MPAPAALDVSVHLPASSLPGSLEKSADARIVDSIPPTVEELKSLFGGVDVDVHDDAGIVGFSS